jgi:hypothetical protein
VELGGGLFWELLCANGVTQRKVLRYKNIYFQIFLMIRNEYLVGTHKVSLEKVKKKDKQRGVFKKLKWASHLFLKCPHKFAC